VVGAGTEEYRDAAWLCRDGVRKAMVRMELNLARDSKNNNKGFYRQVSQKRKVKVTIHSLLSKTGCPGFNWDRGHFPPST